jgi:hypothetical protein
MTFAGRYEIISLEKRTTGNTYQSNGTEDIDIKTLPPLFNCTLRDLLNRIQRPVIDDQTVQTSPSLIRKSYGSLGEIKVRNVAGQNFDLLGAVLLVKLVECRARAGDENEFMGAREEVVGYC